MRFDHRWALTALPLGPVLMAVAATIGTAALAVIVGGGISALAWMLSDPG